MGGAKDLEEAQIKRRRRKEDQAKGEEEEEREDRVRTRGREARATMVGVGEKTAWEIAREAPLPLVLPSARENSELEFMVLVLPPAISDADSISD